MFHSAHRHTHTHTNMPIRFHFFKENVVAGISDRCVDIWDTFWHLQSDLKTKNPGNSAPVPEVNEESDDP